MRGLEKDSPATVVIADDHGVIRSGVASLLREGGDFEIVAEAADVDSLLAAVAGHRPDVAVVDLHMPGRSGPEMIATLRDSSPETRIVVLTMEGTPSFASRALRAGAAGYVLKESAPYVLLEAVRIALAGEVYLEPSLGARLARQRDPDPLEQLTDRERDVLIGVARGLTNREIAASLYVSVRTVESHRASLQKKLGVKGAVRLAELAREQGLVTERESRPDG